MTNLASSIIFGIRNGDKTIHENPARLPVFVGQCTNAVKEVAKYDKGVADALKTINTTSPLLKGVFLLKMLKLTIRLRMLEVIFTPSLIMIFLTK